MVKMHKVTKIIGFVDEKILTIVNEVEHLLGQDDSGHGMDHIYRVLQLAFRLSEKEDCDPYILTYLSLLHDVDDAKLFGETNAHDLPNARHLMNLVKLDTQMQKKIIEGIYTIGFQKRIRGIVPQSIEAKLVSDADMLDALGSHGILRTYDYGKSRNRVFFDPTCFPSNDLQKGTHPTVNHFFEKLLRLNQMMQTQAGKKEAVHRTEIMILFLKHYFEEESEEVWLLYLNDFLHNLSIQENLVDKSE